MFLSGYISTRVLRLSEVGTHPQRQGNDSSPANEKFHLYDRRRTEDKCFTTTQIFQTLNIPSSGRSDLGCDNAVLCAGASLCCSQTHPHRNPTDTCCEICLLCAERRKVRGKKWPKVCFWAPPEAHCAVWCSQYRRYRCCPLIRSYRSWWGPEMRWGLFAAADFPSLCSPRRNMALIHPAVLWLPAEPVPAVTCRLQERCGSTAQGPGTCRGFWEPPTPHSNNQESFILVQGTFLLKVDFPLLGYESRTT